MILFTFVSLAIDMAYLLTAHNHHMGHIQQFLQFSFDRDADHKDCESLVHKGCLLQDRFGGP